MQINDKISGKRIFIRDQQKDDLSFVENTWFDPEVNRYMCDPLREFADEEYYAALAAMEDNADGYYLIIQLKDRDTPIGTCCMFPSADRLSYDIGYTVARSEWRKGYGAEAVALLLQWIRAHGGRTVTCEIAKENTASNALIQKMGFSVDREAEFKKWNMDVTYASYIYKLEL